MTISKLYFSSDFFRLVIHAHNNRWEYLSSYNKESSQKQLLRIIKSKIIIAITNSSCLRRDFLAGVLLPRQSQRTWSVNGAGPDEKVWGLQTRSQRLLRQQQLWPVFSLVADTIGYCIMEQVICSHLKGQALRLGKARTNVRVPPTATQTMSTAKLAVNAFSETLNFSAHNADLHFLLIYLYA